MNDDDSIDLLLRELEAPGAPSGFTASMALASRAATNLAAEDQRIRTWRLPMAAAALIVGFLVPAVVLPPVEAQAEENLAEALAAWEYEQMTPEEEWMFVALAAGESLDTAPPAGAGNAVSTPPDRLPEEQTTETNEEQEC